MWSNVAVLLQCCSLFCVAFHYTCLVGLPRDLADVCSHYRRYSGRSVTLTTRLIMVPRVSNAWIGHIQISKHMMLINNRV
jgi:hypothetical protein